MSAASARTRLRHRRSSRRCARPPIGGSERDLHSQLDRGARHRQPGAHADQPAQAPDGRPARHRARRGLPRVRRCRPRLHRGGRRPVVRLARLRLRAARQGRLRADAHARLLPPLSPPLDTSRRSRSPRSCSRSRRCRWRAWCSSARARRRTTPPSSSPGTTGTRSASRSAPRSSRASMAYHGNTCAAVSLSGKPDMHAGFGLPFAPFKHTEFPALLPPPRGRARPSEQFSARMAEALEALIQAEGPDTDRGVLRRAGHGRRRRDRAADRAISRRCRRCCASTTSCSSPTR